MDPDYYDVLNTAVDSGSTVWAGPSTLGGLGVGGGSVGTTTLTGPSPLKWAGAESGAGVEMGGPELTVYR